MHMNNWASGSDDYIMVISVEFVGGRGTICLSHIALGDYIIHTFNDEMHYGKACEECNIPSAFTMGGVYLYSSDYI